jgi:XrtN system VIT domain protein
MLSYRYFDKLNVWINRLQYVVLGCVIVFYFYLVVYVANIYGIGTVGILFFGIGAHVFVPLTLFTACIFLIRHSIEIRKISVYWVAVGSAFTIGFVLVFMGEWNSRISKIETMANQSVIHENSGLPVWVEVAQRVKKDWISERILKSDLVYTTHNKSFHWDFFPMSRFWGEAKKHDPLVFISSLISKSSLSNDDRVKILQSIFADRHQANERLWSGDNLTTSYIVSDVDIYPALRLAYTEKYLNIRNNIVDNSWRGNTQEAIYTFQLPEGSVVTSLSLWINGKEEKGILTSKQKATEAYKTIVGVESRDPSVIHWQEGNTVTVRVFPCTPEEERKFKIGITSPLIEEDGEIIFKNITFLGPSPSRSKETIRVRFVGASENITMPAYFKKERKGDYVTEQYYNPDFKLSFKALPLPSNQFTFDGYTYSMQSYQPAFESSTFDQIFLDINSSWTSDEIEVTKAWIQNHDVYAVADNEFVQLTDENWEEITDESSLHNFSIFPFHRVRNRISSLIITKGKTLSPHLNDFKESGFSSDIRQYFGSGKKLKVYNLEGGISTYISSLREFRGLEFANGNIDQLNGWLSEGKFPRTEESAERIVLHDSKVAITKKKTGVESKASNNAPDHLARLFAYNNIMRQVGIHYFNDDFISEELVNEASTAYVVSPVSSLIVLETQKDYERFGIEDKVNSLHNATKQATGAVPEPHEWALVMIFLLFVVYLKIRRNKLRLAL